MTKKQKILNYIISEGVSNAFYDSDILKVSPAQINEVREVLERHCLPLYEAMGAK